jgi:uncharacterized protein YndB with AHSA1/START domain/DNA-binding HxlR family transcriptional regulator
MQPMGYGQPDPGRLDATFMALADPTRRAILAKLASGEASVTELAEPFAMTQPAISKHLKVLERAGLISRSHDAQRRPSRLEAKPLAEASQWLENYRRNWKAENRRSPITPTLQISTPSDREISITRVFDAPRRLVFGCFTKPELLKRWGLGPREWTLTECEVDLRVGGAWRYVMTRTDGKEMKMDGVFREIVPPERIVQTEKFDQPWYEGEAINTTTFEEDGGKTILTVTLLYGSKEVRDGILKSGMESGVTVTYDRLAELLPTFTAEESQK